MMISSEKFRLFLNDPKFRQVTNSKRECKELAISKVYPGQKQIHRNQVIMDSIKKKKNPSLPSLDPEVDFLMTRLLAFEDAIADDIQQTYKQKQKIKIEHVNVELLHKNASEELVTILTKAAENEEEEEEDLDIDDIQAAVLEIEELFQEGQRLKKENNEIEKRIKYKRAMLQKS